MPIDYEAWRFWLGIAQLLGTIIIGVYVWWSNREKVTNKRFEAMEKSVSDKVSTEKFDELKDRVAGIESEVKRLPDQAAHKELARRIEDVHADLHEIAGGVKGLARAVDLMNEFLINQGGKR